MTATAFNPFVTPAREGEINMIPEVRDLLMQAGLGQCVVDAFDNNHILNDGVGLCHEAQRFVLNRFFTIQLQSIQNTKNVPTHEERYCLVDSGEPAQWISLFKEKVLPILVEHRFPIVI